MPGVTMPVSRPTGRALIIGSPSCRHAPLSTLQRMGFACVEMDDPYAGMAEISRRPLVYHALILSLTSLYREELLFIQTMKRRWPHVEIWLTHTDGRHAALADAMRLGADGLLSEDGLHRTALGSVDDEPPARRAPAAELDRAGKEAGSETDPVEAGSYSDSELSSSEPILTAEELRALLAEQPITPPAEGE